MRQKDGSYRWSSAAAIVVRDKEGRARSMGRLADGHHRPQVSEERLIHDALHDPDGAAQRSLFWTG